MEQKYTMEEFKNMFEEAREKTIKELSEGLKKHIEEKKQSGEIENGEDYAMSSFMFDLQNITTIAELRRNLFLDK